MKTKITSALILILFLPAAPLHADKSGGAPDISRLPRTITTGPQGPFHVQGIAVDTKRGYIYFSFTTKLLKFDLNGNLIGSVDGLLGHLGCISFNEEDNRVYGSLEYKSDEIGKGIRNTLSGNGSADDGNRNSTGFYAAIFDADRITRPDMDAEKDRIMTAVFIKEAYDDYSATVTNGGKNVEHRFGCSGIDGTTIAPAFGKKGKARFIYLAYGVYGDTARTDNDYQVLLAYNLKKLKRYEQPLSQGNLHRSGPAEPDRKYFVRTGNTSYGVQNLAYDRDSGNFFMAVYKVKKKEFPNYSLFVADGSTAPRKKQLEGFDIPCKGQVLSLLPAGKESAGIRGWNFSLGTCGLCPLGGGYFYISKNESDGKGMQSSTVRLYKWTGNADNPFVAVE